MNRVDVCLSPELVHLHDLKGQIVVVVDILRATSCMVTGIAHGVNSIRPFVDKDACGEMAKQGWLTAGERNGKKLEDFDLGNSPFDYMQDFTKGKNIAVTTTNGTVAIEKAKDADEILIGAFLNLSALANYIRLKKQDVVILCAGWKGKVNMEDSLYAGALTKVLNDTHDYACDAPLIAESAYKRMENDLVEAVKNSSHAKRLNRLNVTKDIEFCMRQDEYDCVPKVRDGVIS